MKIPSNPRNIDRHNYDSDMPAGDREDALFIQAIWSRHLKATPARIKMLELLSNEPLPITADRICELLKDSSNKATTYRSLFVLTKGGLVNKVEIEDRQAHYEIAFGRRHHHHAQCISCGLIEDVEISDDQELNVAALNSLRRFKSIQSHSLEFFGLCKKCS